MSLLASLLNITQMINSLVVFNGKLVNPLIPVIDTAEVFNEFPHSTKFQAARSRMVFRLIQQNE